LYYWLLLQATVGLDAAGQWTDVTVQYW